MKGRGVKALFIRAVGQKVAHKSGKKEKGQRKTIALTIMRKLLKGVRIYREEEGP